MRLILTVRVTNIFRDRPLTRWAALPLIALIALTAFSAARASAAEITSGPDRYTAETLARFTYTQTGSAECKLDDGAWKGCASPTSRSVSVDGQHTFQVRDSVSTDSYSWTLDRVAPTISLTSSDPVDGGISPDGSAELTLEADEPSVSYRCSLDHGAFSICGHSPRYAGLSEGFHVISAIGVDQTGNESTPIYLSFNVRSQPPSTGIGIGPPEETTSTDAHFEVYSSDVEADYECALDGSGYSPCGVVIDLTGLSLGDHALRVRAIDSIGRADPSPAVWEWRVISSGTDPGHDDDPLELTVDSKPRKKSKRRRARFSVSASASNAEMTCSLDGVEFTQGCGDGGELAQRVKPGRHQIRVEARVDGGHSRDDRAYFTYSFRVTRRHH